MDKLKIIGGPGLKGKIQISGAKNAALPLMAASLLSNETITLKNVPHLVDITTMANLLMHMGLEISMNGTNQGIGHTLSLKSNDSIETKATYDLVRKMRASVLVMGPLLAKHKETYVSMPGGCAIGTRPIDLHLKGLEALGAKVTLEEGYAHLIAKDGLIGGDYEFPVISVTGTENIMMAACLAKGTTRLFNVAKEPEIVDLANLLIKMGAKIEGAGTQTLTIHGVESLSGATHDIVPDRIEMGTYIMAAGITNGEIEITNGDLTLLPTVVDLLKKTGLEFIEKDKGFIVRRKDPKKPLKAISVSTNPYPDFPTDLQAQYMAMMVTAEGDCTITENIFENRFMHIAELLRMGANIHIDGSVATVKGVKELIGADVMATDLRASASLVLAGLAAKGETIVHRIYHLDRGYEHIETKLSECGALVERTH